MSPVELPVVAAPVPHCCPSTGDSYAEVARRVRLLSWLSLAWMSAEGAVAIAAGIVASSIALVGFGLDQVVEGAASVIITWASPATASSPYRAEERAQKFVTVQFSTRTSRAERPISRSGRDVLQPVRAPRSPL